MTTVATGYAPINGMQLYYEVHGEGFPTILLHGGIGASEMFGENLAEFAKGRQVVAVHLQGHGKTKDIDRPLRSELLADDIAALVRHLGLEQVDLVGYSFGGGVTFQTAFRHPDLVRKIVVVAEAAKTQAWFPEVRTAFDAMEANAAAIGPMVQQSPMGQIHPEVDFTTLFARMGELVKQDYDWMDDIAQLTCRVMLVMADADGFDPAHYVEVFKVLGGGQRDAGLDNSGRPVHQLAIVPNANHYDILSASTMVSQLATPFLDA